MTSTCRHVCGACHAITPRSQPRPDCEFGICRFLKEPGNATRRFGPTSEPLQTSFGASSARKQQLPYWGRRHSRISLPRQLVGFSVSPSHEQVAYSNSGGSDHLTQLSVLRVLREAPRTAGRLGFETELSPTSVTRIVDRLEWRCLERLLGQLKILRGSDLYQAVEA